jgi:hypothetical protein
MRYVTLNDDNNQINLQLDLNYIYYQSGERGPVILYSLFLVARTEMLTTGAIVLIFLGGFLGIGLFTGSVVVAVYGSQNTTGVRNVVDATVQSLGLDGAYGGATVDCTFTYTHGLATIGSCVERTTTSPTFEGITLNSTAPTLQLIDESSPNPSIEIGSADDGDDYIQWLYFNLLHVDNLTLFAKTGKHGYYIHQIDDTLTIGGTTATGTAEDEITTTRDAIKFTPETLELRSPVKVTGVDDAKIHLNLDEATEPHVEIGTYGEGSSYIAFDMKFLDGIWNATSSTHKGAAIMKGSAAISFVIAPVVDEGTEATPVPVATISSTGLTLAIPPTISTFTGDKLVVSAGSSFEEGPAHAASTVDIVATGGSTRTYAVSASIIGDQVTVIVCEKAATTFVATAALVTLSTLATAYRPPTVTACGGGGVTADAVVGTDGAICITTGGVITMGIKTAGVQAVLTNGVAYNLGCMSVQYQKP